jgi:hypothetical protein
MAPRRPERNENQPRRNEEHEDVFYSSFAFFVSSWLILEEIEHGKEVEGKESRYSGRRRF